MSVADEIWNRACIRNWTQPRGGDRALGALLLFHSAAMIGGIDHAIECLTAKEIEDAASGYRYFGFERVADMVCDAPAGFRGLDDYAHEAYLASCEKIYARDISSDAALVERFQHHSRLSS